jgi:hypothetical protein
MDPYRDPFVRIQIAKFRELATKCDQFHDWVIWSVTVKPDMSEPDTETATQLNYNAEVVLNDPYRRYDITRVTLEFLNLEIVKIPHLKTTMSELTALEIHEIQYGVRVTCDYPDSFEIEASELNIIEP